MIWFFREDRHDRGGGFNDRYERGYDGPPAGRNFGGGRGGGAGAGGAGGGAARGGQAAEDADGVKFWLFNNDFYIKWKILKPFLEPVSKKRQIKFSKPKHQVFPSSKKQT